MRSFGRPLAFFFVGAAIVFVIDLAPSDESRLALLAVLGLAFAGGLLARSRIELAALVIGSAAGGLLSALVQFGNPGGPSTVESALTGIAFVAVLMWFVGNSTFGLKARFAGPPAPSRVGGSGPRGTPASAGPRELRPNTLSIDLVPNRLSAIDTAKAPGQVSRPQQVRSPRR